MLPQKMQEVASCQYKVMQLDSRRAVDMLYVNKRLIHHVREEMGDHSYGVCCTVHAERERETDRQRQRESDRDRERERREKHVCAVCDVHECVYIYVCVYLCACLLCVHVYMYVSLHASCVYM